MLEKRIKDKDTEIERLKKENAILNEPKLMIKQKNIKFNKEPSNHQTTPRN